MKEGRSLPVIQPGVEPGVSRRAALQTLAAGVGASLAVPGLAAADDHPVHKHVAHAGGQARTPSSQSKPAGYTPVTFDAHQFATVVLLADLIVPGAKASGTPEFLDKLLAAESSETRRRFFTALGAMEGAALKMHRSPFKDLTPDQQNALLTEASAAQPGRAPVFWKKGDPIPVPEGPAGPPTLRDHFDHVKGWVSGIHFASEPGMKALGYTGNVFHETYPGCQHNGQHG